MSHKTRFWACPSISRHFLPNPPTETPAALERLNESRRALNRVLGNVVHELLVRENIGSDTVHYPFTFEYAGASLKCSLSVEERGGDLFVQASPWNGVSSDRAISNKEMLRAISNNITKERLARRKRRGW